MHTNKWMDKEDLYVHNEMLLSHEKNEGFFCFFFLNILAETVLNQVNADPSAGLRFHWFLKSECWGPIGGTWTRLPWIMWHCYHHACRSVVLRKCLTSCNFFHHTASCAWLPWPGTEPAPPAVEAQSLDHWTARKALATCIYGSLQWLIISIGFSIGSDEHSSGLWKRNRKSESSPNQRRWKELWSCFNVLFLLFSL